MITDIAEMHYPYLAIITACHDCKIRIFVKELKRVVGVLETGHFTGIRQLDYTPFHGGALISVGYENFFNIWEMDGSLSFGKRQKELANRFPLVNQPIVGARFLASSAFVVCVD